MQVLVCKTYLVSLVYSVFRKLKHYTWNIFHTQEYLIWKPESEE